jgi:hypothetical protein
VDKIDRLDRPVVDCSISVALTVAAHSVAALFSSDTPYASPGLLAWVLPGKVYHHVWVGGGWVGHPPLPTKFQPPEKRSLLTKEAEAKTGANSHQKSKRGLHFFRLLRCGGLYIGLLTTVLIRLLKSNSKLSQHNLAYLTLELNN